MAHKKAGGSAKNLTDSNAQYLGIKKHDGEAVKTGVIILRQRGTTALPGTNVGMGKDHTLYALKNGVVSFHQIRKQNFTGKMRVKKQVRVR